MNLVGQGRAKHKALIVLLLRLAYASVARAQTAPSVVGNYTGALGSFHIRLHVRAGANGALAVTLDSVDQGVFGISCTEVTLSGRQFRFSIPSIHATYQGHLNDDGNTIVGSWNLGTPQPLVFIRLTEATAGSLTERLAGVGSLVAEDLEKNKIGSVTVGVVSGKQLIWTKSYGDADMGRHIQANEARYIGLGRSRRCLQR